MAPSTAPRTPADAIPDYIRRNVNMLMTDRGLTNEQLAAAIGVKPQTASLKRRGRIRFQLAELGPLAELFRVPPHQLLVDPDERFGTTGLTNWYGRVGDDEAA
jgi:transcriptional regulator with XRE-family HTH domain